jgi:hypothetical protein
MKIVKIVMLGVALAIVTSPAISQQAEPPKGFRATLKARAVST